MKCGSCQGEHETVAETRSCYGFAESNYSGKPEPDQAAVVIPEGYYAVRSRTGNNDLDFFWVKVKKGGYFKGRMFVDRIIGGNPPIRLSRGEQSWALAAIAKAGIEASAKLFSTEMEACNKCKSPLTKYASRTLGIGPECADHIGLGDEWRRIQREFDASQREPLPDPMRISPKPIRVKTSRIKPKPLKRKAGTRVFPTE